MLLLTIFIAICCAWSLIQYIRSIIAYNKSAYKAITHNTYFETKRDSGKSGEYSIYSRIQKFGYSENRFLFNVYLPSSFGNTSEIDIILISQKCVVAIESKNYSGWIFGNDSQQTWTQTLPTRRGRSNKEHFYNPVMQNRTHCQVLKNYLPRETPVYSVVLFSDKCTFKNVTISANDVIVGHFGDAETVVTILLSTDRPNVIDVNQVYELLYPFSQVSEEKKQAHIDTIKTKHEQ